MPAPNKIVGTGGANNVSGTGGDDLIYGFNPDAVVASGITATRMTNQLGFNRPVEIVSNPIDGNHIFIVTLAGRIDIVDLKTGNLNATPLLDVTGEVPPIDYDETPGASNDKGLSSMAFDPDFANNGKFYTYGTNYEGTINQLWEYTVQAGNPLAADVSTRRLIAEWDQMSGTNHRVGDLNFGPDGYLYINRADGGNPFDPFLVTQDTNSLLGKILRIDLAGDDFPGDPKRNYSIPADNPFADGTGGAPEIWGIGVRNAFRNSFDAVTGDFWVADVGQNTWEEVNKLPDSTAPGVNLGWVYWEGNHATYLNPDPTDTAGYTFPIYEFPHIGSGENNSVIGGYVYRGTSEALQGNYFFGDFSQGSIYSLKEGAGAPTVTDWTSEISYPLGDGIQRLVSYGQDAEGNLYALDITGDLYLLTPQTTTRADANDTIGAGNGDDYVYAGGGNDAVDGGAGHDVLSGMDGDDTLLGAAGNDSLIGAAGTDLLTAGEGDDTLLGGTNNDTLQGGSGDDFLDGGENNDRLTGGAGADQLRGGPGKDKFIFETTGDSTTAAPDTILDFSSASKDRIDISKIQQVAVDFLRTDAFRQAGTAEVRYETTSYGVLVQLDANGDGVADLAIKVFGVTSLGANDFML